MNGTRVQSLLIGLMLGATPNLLAGPSQVARQEPHLPVVVGGFRLINSTQPDVLAGTAFDYRDSAGTRVVVSLHLLSAPPSEDSAAGVERDAPAYLRSLAPEPPHDGPERYEVVVDTVRQIETDGGSVPVRILVFVFRRPEGAFVSFAHLFVFGDQYLKVRLTLPSEVWQSSSAPNFALDLIKRLHSRERGLRPP